MSGVVKTPRQGFSIHARRPERILFLCCFERQGVPSVIEIVETIQRLSKFPVTVLNLYEHKASYQYLSLPADYDLNIFSSVVIHNTVSYNPDNLRALDRQLKVKFKDYAGVKILLKQDDHYRFAETRSFLIENKFDVVFTLTPSDEVHKVYGGKGFENIFEVNHMLAGYVTPNMREFIYSEDRPIDIGYRGSIMPLAFGRLCYEKRKIGDDVLRLLKGRPGLKLDISSEWIDRLGGASWYDFLKKSKCVLGVESGSGIFDLDGCLSERCKAIEREIGPFKKDPEYAEKYLSALSEYEGNVKYFMISPRHFEAISCGAVQILFPGRYTDRMIAGRHYLTLERDYKNLDSILDQVLDPLYRKEFAQRAFEEVILNKINWIEKFVEELDNSIDRCLNHKNIKVSTAATLKRDDLITEVLLIQAHEYGSDPRRDKWIPGGAPRTIRIHQLVVDRKIDSSHLQTIDSGGIVYSVPFQRASSNSFSELAFDLGPFDDILLVLSQLKYAVTLSDKEFAEFFGAPRDSKRLDNFRWYISYLLDTTESLLKGFLYVRGFSCVIAVNLPTLLAACIAKKLYGVSLAYEALEYWPEADPDAQQFEVDFWIDLEKKLLKNVDSYGTVSPGLAAHMGHVFGVQFNYLPNCCPLNSYVPPSDVSLTTGKLRFVYQGSFAPHRGLEELVEAFSSPRVKASLILRGFDNEYKLSLLRECKRRGVLNTKVHFPPPVHANELVQSAASSGDVGLIPYKSTGENYKNCSPNKMGQYFAAGLPILANKTDFVSEIIGLSKAGRVADFGNVEQLIDVIESLDNNRTELAGFAENSLNFYRSYFNWNYLSKDFYKEIDRISKFAVTDFDGFRIYHSEEKPVEFGSFYLQRETKLFGRELYLAYVRRAWHLIPAGARQLLKPILLKGIACSRGLLLLVKSFTKAGSK